MRGARAVTIWGVIAVLACALAFAAEEVAAAFPKPQTDGGMPLMQALKLRRTTREFDTKKLPDQVLSNLLWAADGVNREDSGKRTAPSAMNWQEIDIYAATVDGLFLYDAKGNALQEILKEDIRAKTGRQSSAPLILVYVADYAKTGNSRPEDRAFYTACDTGFISQNVYLFCASEGLATVVRGGIDREGLAQVMKLRADQKITLCQNVGYPKAQ